MTPAAAVFAAVRDCAEAGVRAVVVGFAEVSPEGAATQARIRDLARGAGSPPRTAPTTRGRSTPSGATPGWTPWSSSTCRRYARWRDRPPGRPFALEPDAVARVRGTIAAALAGGEGKRWLSPQAVETVLAAAGIGTAPFRVVPAEAAIRWW